MSVSSKYGIIGTLYLVICTLRTKLLFPTARLIRFPADIRGRKFIKVSNGFTTGRGCRLEALPQNIQIGPCIIIGSNVQMNDYVHITGIRSVQIGDNVLIASKVYISDVTHGNYRDDKPQSEPSSIPTDRPLVHYPVKIGNNVWIGDGACILPGVTIGDGSIIGANAVVNKDVPSNCMVGGVPARVLKQYNHQTKKWESVK